jgi:hypothetical protein
MTDHIGIHEQYALVSPQTFVDRFAERWTEQFGMPASNEFKSLWRIMANTYQEAIIDAASNRPYRWRVLQPPTGSGKTTGAVVYAGMQADLNARAEANHRKPVGILIVTRLKAQADEVVLDINYFVGRPVAVADHTGHRATPEELQASDIVVITQQAYTNARQTQSGVRADRWTRLTNWKGGRRLLTIIDEALANAVEENQIKIDELSRLIGYIPYEMRQTHAIAVEGLEDLLEHMGNLAGINAGFGISTTLAWEEGFAPINVDLTLLRTDMRTLRYDKMIGKDDEEERQRIARRVDKTFSAVGALLDQHAYMTRTGTQHSLNSSALAVPFGVPGPVVLDATAGVDLLYKLMEDRAIIIPAPPGVRDYGNVTLHVAWTKGGIGKAKMVEHAMVRFPRLIADLKQRLPRDRKVFFCVHQKVEHKLPDPAELPFGQTACAHWGAVDGSNKYKDFDTAVIFGLPFRDHIWGTNVFFALQGVQDDPWHDNPVWKGHPNVRELLQRRHIAASIIQAMGRVQLRKVVDAHGRCAATDVYLVLPSGERGQEILGYIRQDLPNIAVEDWPFELDGPKVRLERKGLPQEGLIAYMKQRDPGQTPMSMIKREFGLKPHVVKDLQKVLREENHEITLALKAAGVSYGAEGKGRGARSYLLKAA